MKYTREDFGKAKFAEHEDGDIAIKWGDSDSGLWETQNVTADDEEMADDGWVPVPTKPTLTDSEVGEIVKDWQSDDYLTGFIAGYQHAGGRIIDDTEPTNTERLAELLYSNHLVGLELNESSTLAEYLNDLGVTITVKDN